ncbi:hypothetical protein C0J45_9902 [Silurus meridionalis]|nr:hypothetical protein C0J45_9902 [Silurus meridionalis]
MLQLKRMSKLTQFTPNYTPHTHRKEVVLMNPAHCGTSSRMNQRVFPVPHHTLTGSYSTNSKKENTLTKMKIPVSDRRSSHELTAMWVVALAALLLHGSVHTAQSDFISKTFTEGSSAFLYCGNNGSVFWSKGVKEGRRTIITAKHGEGTIKHIPDPEFRFSVLSDLSLYMRNVFLSDSGIYYCNAVPLYNLIITPVQSSTAPTAPPSDDKDSWMVPVVVSVSCLVVLLLALSVWRCFTKRKRFSVKQNQKLYDSIKNLADAPQSGEEQRERESVYFLPQNPTSNTTDEAAHDYTEIQKKKC